MTSPVKFALVVTVAALPVVLLEVVAFPDNAPENVVADNVALLASNVKLAFVFAS